MGVMSMFSTRIKQSAQALSIAFCLTLTSLPMAAQVATGSISGVIQDPQSAVIANAKVTLVNQSQGASSARQIPTNGEGTFVFTPVLPGTYTLSVEAAGFK